MSQENVEIVLGQFADPINDADEIVGTWAEDIELVIDAPLGIRAGRFVGKSAALGWFEEWFSTFQENVEFEVTKSMELGDGRVLVVANHRGRGRGSGVEVEMEVAWLFELRDDKISRMTHYRTEAEALEAVGLSE